jgi:hypothetical protein
VGYDWGNLKIMEFDLNKLHNLPYPTWIYAPFPHENGYDFFCYDGEEIEFIKFTLKDKPDLNFGPLVDLVHVMRRSGYRVDNFDVFYIVPNMKVVKKFKGGHMFSLQRLHELFPGRDMTYAVEHKLRVVVIEDESDRTC